MKPTVFLIKYDEIAYSDPQRSGSEHMVAYDCEEVKKK